VLFDKYRNYAAAFYAAAALSLVALTYVMGQAKKLSAVAVTTEP
jgi:hypothetical protein